MNTKTLFLLLSISIFLFSCNSTVKDSSIVPISNLDTDFPVTENLDFKPFHKYDILEMGACMVDDSILWFFREAQSDFGFCYNLHTGEKLSTIASKGRAANELGDLNSLNLVGDSVVFCTSRNVVKTFAKKDIVDNIPMGERKFSVTIAPDSILLSNLTKLPNGSVLATIEPALSEHQKEGKISESNQKSVVLFNNQETKFYETIKYESFELEKATGKEFAANDLIKSAYSLGRIATKKNDMAVFSMDNQFMLYTLDLKSGSVVNEKRYTKMQREAARSDNYISITVVNDRRISINTIVTNDKYIFCRVSGYLSEEDEESKRHKEALFVFDWELNPIKKFALSSRENGCEILSNDGSAVYFCEFNEDGLTLQKADLNL